MTKGIWIWVQPHPVKTGTSMVMLDTEGLYDAEKVQLTNKAMTEYPVTYMCLDQMQE